MTEIEVMFSATTLSPYNCIIVLYPCSNFGDLEGKGRERMMNSLTSTKDIYLVYICHSYSEHDYGIEGFINFIFISNNSLL